jgi:transposase InsO family protein
MERKERMHHTREFKLEAVRLESFFHSLKTELVMHCDYKTRDQARACLFDYMEVFYNRQRRHSTIYYVAPLAFEESTTA